MPRRLAAAAIVSMTALGPLGASAKAQEARWTRVQEEAVGLLREYVRVDTSNPPGTTTAAADLLQRILEREGIAATRYESSPGKTILLARLSGTGPGKPILLLHHMDVVPVDRARWPRDPFGAEVVDGELWGRGAIDMKGLGVMHLLAFLELKRQAVPLARDVILMAVPDEEIGGAGGARWMLDHHASQLDVDYVLDEGGFGSRDLFADGRLVFGISVAEKRMVWLRIRAEGVAGHGSQPHDQNPNDRLTKALARLLAEPLPTSGVEVLEVMRGRIGAFAVNKFTNAIAHSTIALTTLRSGVGDPPKVNVIPSVAEATLDCRVLPGTTTAEWLNEIRRRLGDPALGLEVVYESDDPRVSSWDTPLYRALDAAIARHHPGAVVSPILIPYGTDSNAFRPRGAQSYGVAPVVLSVALVASMHGDAERVPVAGLGTGARIFFEALKETAGR